MKSPLRVILLLALGLGPSRLAAQGMEFTVRSEFANVHRSPSTGSPIIGTTPRGAVLTVTRELGSWVKISWPRAADGVGYVHVSTGTIAWHIEQQRVGRGETVSALPVIEPSPVTVRRTTPAPAPSQKVPSVVTVYDAPPSRSSYVTLPRHAVGLGAQFDESTAGVGATARAWSSGRVGVQFELSHEAITTAAPGSVASLRFAPSVLLSLGDHIAGFAWLRPYVGGGVGIVRQTLTLPGMADSSSTELGVQTFGGGEITFANVPWFALSADLGYRRSRTPFAGFEPARVGVSLSAHWYLK